MGTSVIPCMEDGARIGKGDDGVEVAGRSWITKTQSRREKANNLKPPEQVTSPTMKDQEQSLQGHAKQRQLQQSASFRVKAAEVGQCRLTLSNPG
jgi:hypothetical protein